MSRGSYRTGEQDDVIITDPSALTEKEVWQNPIMSDPQLSKELLNIDPKANEFINIYPYHEEKTVATPIKDSKGDIMLNKNGEVLYDLKPGWVRIGYKKEKVRLPIISINSDMVKSQIGPREMSVILRLQTLINMLVFRQYKERKIFTNNIVRFANEIRTILNLRRAFGGFAARLSKSNVLFSYSGTDEASDMLNLEERLRKESGLIEKAKEKLTGGGRSVRDEADRIARNMEYDNAQYGKTKRDWEMI